KAQAGEWALLPPTMATLTELTGYDTVADVLAAPRTITTFAPQAEIIDGEAWLVLPDGAREHYFKD
ncbi:NUDIX hydrolase, partial [Actinomadura adrarensis]